jgi:ParB family chromosome partitioning protein
VIQEIDILLIKPNPYQTRRSEDPAHVIKLADSILQHGMLQIPAGRKVTDNAGMDYYQLAFGHSRHAAYCLLDQNGNVGFATMPLNVSELNDLEMFEQAVIENSQRKDINVIEMAHAMTLYRCLSWVCARLSRSFQPCCFMIFSLSLLGGVF